MTERFLSVFTYIEQTLGSAGVFLISVASVFILFAITVILAACKVSFSLKRRRWYFFAVSAVILCEYGLSFFIGGAGYVFLTAAITAILSIPVITVQKKEKNTDAREFAKFLDDKILKRSTPPAISQPEVQPLEEELNECGISQKDKKSTAVNLAKKESVKGVELDFTHVKNVLARLEYYGLSPSEKKIIEGLDNAITAAENDQIDQKVKSKINDGLGALLKIMSKYGI